MGCASSNSAVGDGTQNAAADSQHIKSANKKKEEDDAPPSFEQVQTNYPPSEAYVISFNSDENSSNNRLDMTTSTWSAAKQETIRPPERLQKVLEEHSNSNITESIETITEKLEKAEQRRQAILQEKVEKAQKLTKTLDETTILENESSTNQS